MDLGLSGKAILVIAVDERDRESCSASLTDEGALVLAAQGPEGALEQIRTRYGQVDGVVFYLSVHGDHSVLTATTQTLLTAWEEVVGVIDTLRLAAEEMATRQWGRLVTVLPSEVKSLHEDDDDVASIAGLGLLGLQKAAVADVASSGICANAILRTTQSSPSEVADAVAFLLSDGAGYLHGVTLSFDGAQSASMF